MKNASRSLFRQSVALLAMAFVAGILTLSLGGASAATTQEEVGTSSLVTVDLMGDGTITAITTQDDTEGELDPSKNADQLPVRILTSWTVGEKSGSDWGQVAGTSGPLSVALNIQNTTGRLESVSVDANGRTLSRQHIITEPLTVVASARLEGISPDQVVTQSM